jgi:hypothetical protein
MNISAAARSSPSRIHWSAISRGKTARFGIAPPFYTAEFGLHLKPAAEQGSTVLDAQRRLAALGEAVRTLTNLARGSRGTAQHRMRLALKFQ